MAMGAEYGNGWEVGKYKGAPHRFVKLLRQRRALSIFLKTLRKINCKTLLQGCTKIKNVFII